jgi:hypothetical protein
MSFGSKAPLRRKYKMFYRRKARSTSKHKKFFIFFHVDRDNSTKANYFPYRFGKSEAKTISWGHYAAQIEKPPSACDDVKQFESDQQFL